MISIDDLPFLGHITEAKVLDQGGQAVVYRLSTTYPTPFPLCAKVFNFNFVYPSQISSDLEKEARVNQSLYEAGISVPRPVGLFRLLSSVHSSPVPSFVRECIEGRTYGQLFPWQKEKAVKVFEEERLKAIEIGFIPKDCYPTKNCLYTVKGWSVKSVTLFDFSFWGRE